VSKSKVVMVVVAIMVGWQWSGSGIADDAVRWMVIDEAGIQAVRQRLVDRWYTTRKQDAADNAKCSAVHLDNNGLFCVAAYKLD